MFINQSLSDLVCLLPIFISNDLDLHSRSQLYALTKTSAMINYAVEMTAKKSGNSLVNKDL